MPLHPTVLGEGAASLLPGQDRPAVVWRMDLDADGVVTDVDVRRALVRSRARLDHAGVQHAIDAGTAEVPVALLRAVGRLREAQERVRGGTAPLPLGEPLAVRLTRADPGLHTVLFTPA